MLQRNIERNAVSLDYTVQALNYAAWDTRTKLGLIYADDKHTGGSTRVSTIEAERPIYAWPIDLLLEMSLIPYAPDLVKIDVEGAEAHVLRGMHRTVYKHKPVLFIEMHDMYWGPQIRKEVLQFLGLMGYQCRGGR